MERRCGRGEGMERCLATAGVVYSVLHGVLRTECSTSFVCKGGDVIDTGYGGTLGYDVQRGISTLGDGRRMRIGTLGDSVGTCER